MPSRVIRRYQWRADPPALDIEFTTGRVYRYHEVPRDVAEEMLCCISKGTFFNRHIRGSYACERLRGGWPDEPDPVPA